MMVLMACTIAVSSPIMMVGGVVMALREDMGLGWILAVVVPALFLSVGFVVSRMVLVPVDAGPHRRGQPGAARADHGHPRRPGVRAEPQEARQFSRANDDLTEVAVRAGRWMLFPMVMLVVNVSSVAVIWFGGHRINGGEMLPGAMTAFSPT